MIIVNLLLNQKSFYYSLTRIAQIMGKRDHSTIIYNRDEFRNWVTTDEAMQTLLKNTHLHVFNSTNMIQFIEPGQKLVQFVLLPYHQAKLLETTEESFSTTQRGEGGFGSTGIS